MFKQIVKDHPTDCYILIFIFIFFLIIFYNYMKGNGSFNSTFTYPNNIPYINKFISSYGNKKFLDILSNFNPRKEKIRESKGERECRNVLESLFGVKFPNTRPHFLLNDITGKRLELDCYNESMRLAVEYQGIQHAKHVPFFHNTEADFHAQVYRDKLKRKLCIKYGIDLIEVPHTIKISDIRVFIYAELQRLGRL